MLMQRSEDQWGGESRRGKTGRGRDTKKETPKMQRRKDRQEDKERKRRSVELDKARWTQKKQVR